jgi:hypothetical protein
MVCEGKVWLEKEFTVGREPPFREGIGTEGEK